MRYARIHFDGLLLFFLLMILSGTITGQEANTGYNLRQLRSFTGSVSIVDSAMLTSPAARDITELLQGAASGVNVTGSGQPGIDSKVRIRGFSSFLNNDPLYIVDGVPTQDITSLNPGDVDQISILKDAGAGTIYGSRASNGVIVITTKKGLAGFHVNYNMYMGAQLPGKGTVDDVLNTREYADLQWLVYRNDGTDEINPIYGPSSGPSPVLPPWAANTDWYKEITHRSFITNHDLSFSGGGKNAKFFASIGYLDQNGIIIYNNSSRYSARINSDFTILKERVKVGENLAITSRSKVSVPNLSEGSPIQTGPYRSQSIIPVLITDTVNGPGHQFLPGEWGGTGMAMGLGNVPNEVAVLTRNKNNLDKNTRLTGNIYIDVKIAKGLTFRSLFGMIMDDGSSVDYSLASYENLLNRSYSIVGENTYINRDRNWTNTISYSLVSGKHKIDAVAGSETMSFGSGHQMYSHHYLSNGALIDTSYFTQGPKKMISMFLKADYTFSAKYIISIMLRSDYSSMYAPSMRNAVFPAFSVGWIAGEEPFLRRLKWLSFLKLRASYGLTGNQLAISPVNAFFQDGMSSSSGFNTSMIPNPNAKNEVTTQSDVGFDTRVLNNTFGMVFDLYSKKSRDIFFGGYLADIFGNINLPFVNSASMNTSGVDIDFSYHNKWNKVGFKADLVFSAYKNKILKIADGTKFFTAGSSSMGSISRNQTGNSLSAFYGYLVTGLFQNQTEVNNAPLQYGAEPGFFRFANLDNTSTVIDAGVERQVIDPSDRTFIGDPNPDFTSGINVALTWNNFDLACFIYSSQGNDIFNYNKWFTDFWPSFKGQKSKRLLYDSWTSSATNATLPKASDKTNFSTDTEVTSYYIEDGSYIRIKSLQLGFTLPSTLMNRIRIKSLRVYLEAVNLFTITHYSGLDPEIGGSDLSFGIDSGNYPKTREFIFGINLAL